MVIIRLWRWITTILSERKKARELKREVRHLQRLSEKARPQAGYDLLR